MEYREYFLPIFDYFWQSEEGGAVFSIPGSRTIAYRDFVGDILKYLAPQGLPPFGSLLLAIIATNPNGADDVLRLVKTMRISAEHVDLKPRFTETTLGETKTFLDLLDSLPQKYKQGKNRVLVYQAIFEQCHRRVSLKNSKTIVKDYTERKGAGFDDIEPVHLNEYLFDRDFRTIALLRHRFKTTDDIIQKILSLPELSAEIPELEEDYVGAAPATVQKDLVDQLTDNNKTFHIGALIRHIWSGLNMPLHSRLPSSQPLGGVSDLSNKGDLDKLLISEFANDELLFLSRLANNEALYINREIPPEHNDIHRVILIDVSIKNWGTPKTVAFAAMLAIARHPKTNIQCSVFAVGEGIVPISTDSVDGLIAGIQVLHAGIHAANGIEAFFKEYPANDHREVFVITTRATLKSDRMLQAVTDHHAAVHYWIYTDAEGNIDVYKKQQNSKRHLQHIKLPLDELWQQKEPTKSQPESHRKNDSIFPLLFRLAPNTKEILELAGVGAFNITTEQTVMRCYGADKGWDLLPCKIPDTAVKFALGSKNNQPVLLMFSVQFKVISLRNLNTGDQTDHSFKEWKGSKYENFIFREGAFYYLQDTFYWMISTEGKIEKSIMPHGGLYTYYEGAERERKTVKGRFKTKVPVLKNITEVFINQLGNLVFNVHELMLDRGTFMRMEKSGFLKPTVAANKDDTNIFKFPDGSTVEVERNGMLILQSSDHSIPTIYIASVIEATTAGVAGGVFAGNDYFYKDVPITAIVRNGGPHKEQVIRMLFQNRNGGVLYDAQYAVESPLNPYLLNSKTNLPQLRYELDKAGAEVSFKEIINNQTGEGIERISVGAFFDKYIKRYINQIMSHGT